MHNPLSTDMKFKKGYIEYLSYKLIPIIDWQIAYLTSRITNTNLFWSTLYSLPKYAFNVLNIEVRILLNQVTC